MVNLLRGIFGLCVINTLMFAAIIGILTARRKERRGGSPNATRRGGRLYVTVAEIPLTRPWNPAAFDRAKEPDSEADEGEG